MKLGNLLIRRFEIRRKEIRRIEIRRKEIRKSESKPFRLYEKYLTLSQKQNNKRNAYYSCSLMYSRESLNSNIVHKSNKLPLNEIFLIFSFVASLLY